MTRHFFECVMHCCVGQQQQKNVLFFVGQHFSNFLKIFQHALKITVSGAFQSCVWMHNLCQKCSMIDDAQKFVQNCRKIGWKIRENTDWYFRTKSQFPKGISVWHKVFLDNIFGQILVENFKFGQKLSKIGKIRQKFPANFPKCHKFPRKIRRKKSRQKMG